VDDVYLSDNPAFCALPHAPASSPKHQFLYLAHRLNFYKNCCGTHQPRISRHRAEAFQSFRIIDKKGAIALGYLPDAEVVRAACLKVSPVGPDYFKAFRAGFHGPFICGGWVLEIHNAFLLIR